MEFPLWYILWAKIGLSWDDACIVSAHGRDCSLLPLIRTNRKVFAILGTKDKVAEIAGRLHTYGMDDVLLYVGENLSYKNEKIFVKKPAELLDYQGGRPQCPQCLQRKSRSSSGDSWISGRGVLSGEKPPMTKTEVRTVSLGKLRLTEDAVCYDVGAERAPCP